MATIFDLLEQDHQKVKQTLQKIMDTTDGAEKTRTKLLNQIKHELEVHTQFEEDTFYPKARKATAMDENIDDALEEHDEAKDMLEKLCELEPTSAEWMETVQELSEALNHHIEDEEKDLFPECRKAIADDDAEAMGQEYEKAKEQAAA